MNKKSARALAFLPMTLMLGCGDGFKGQQVTQAPTTQAAAGFLLKDVSEAQLGRLLRENPAAKYREINRAHGLYEFSFVGEEVLRQYFPDKKIQKNKVFKVQSLGTETLAGVDAMRALPFAPNTEAGEEMRPCQKNPIKPLVNIQEASPGSAPSQIELGGSVRLSSRKSVAHPKFPGKLRRRWVVIPPDGSNRKEEAIAGEDLVYTPDSLGGWAILLIVQDERDVCAGQPFVFGVTRNETYQPQARSAERRPDLGLFKHLEDIHAIQAWSKSTGEGVVIAVVDSGVNFNHPALVSNIRVNHREIPGNGKDDDSNGLVDDYAGYDFANSDSSAFDDGGHGSHVAGLAASSHFGVAKGAKILPVKAMSAVGSGDIGSIVGGILYAVDQGANIVNMSFGSYGPPHPLEAEAMDYAKAKGVLLVVAAGNGHPQTGEPLDIDVVPCFPAAFPHENLLSVAARDRHNLLAPYSNYGSSSVDVVAPGGGDTDKDPDNTMMSTYYDNPRGITYIGKEGTSMSTPVAAGVAALVLSLRPELTPSQVIEVLKNAGPEVPGLRGKVQSGRYLDALDAVAGL